MNDITSLKHVPLFSNMDEQEIAGIRALMDQASYPEGKMIVRANEPGELFYVILQGHIRILIKDAAGAEIVIAEMGPGDFFGELSLLSGEPRSASVQALGRVEALTLKRTEFLDFLQQHPHAAVDVLMELGRRQLHTDALLRKSVSRNVNTLADERLTFGQRVADTVADTMGSWRFISVQSTLLMIWIVLNVTAWIQHWDPYPFILLNLALSFQAAYAAPFIMMSQNRQAAKDRLAAEIDHQVNAQAELEIGMVLHRLDELERSIQRSQAAPGAERGRV